jgi:hypothetical protein
LHEGYVVAPVSNRLLLQELRVQELRKMRSQGTTSCIGHEGPNHYSEFLPGFSASPFFN